MSAWGEKERREEEKDPDEFIKNLGSDEYQKRIDSAKDSFIFEIEMMKSEFNLSEVNVSERNNHLRFAEGSARPAVNAFRFSDQPPL